MKKELPEFVYRCLVCQHVKVKYQVPSKLLQPIQIPQWKGDRVTIDCMTGFSITRQRHDAIWIIVDNLTKLAHFLQVRIDYTLKRWLVRSCYSDDILRYVVIDFKGSWEDHLPLVEFAYNNSFQSSIQMAPEEALYGITNIFNEGKIVGHDLIRETEEKGKLTPDFIGPYEILEKTGLVAYQLALSSELENIYKVFHVSMLKRYYFNPSQVIPLKQIDVSPNMAYEEESIRILVRDVKELMNKMIPLVKMLWRNHSIEETT
ncbi:uncharacterized protein LOC120120915 [Hibiscus syriacus]|uniref:uncharacterized protein LOC120120915 n=1 Tax=Hibiscus syriacus TaxID=106335 RepID=UPI00192353E0|nr:uncharacterized protein LOC120120915 [Hibiscus syriacus]